MTDTPTPAAARTHEEIAKAIDGYWWKYPGYAPFGTNLYRTVDLLIKAFPELVSAAAPASAGASDTDAADRAHAREIELQEIADGAYGDGSFTRGLARDALGASPPAPESDGGKAQPPVAQEARERVARWYIRNRFQDDAETSDALAEIENLHWREYLKEADEIMSLFAILPSPDAATFRAGVEAAACVARAWDDAPRLRVELSNNMTAREMTIARSMASRIEQDIRALTPPLSAGTGEGDVREREQTIETIGAIISDKAFVDCRHGYITNTTELAGAILDAGLLRTSDKVHARPGEPAVGPVTFTLIDRQREPVRLALTMPDGRILKMQPEGEVSRHEARVICGGIMNCMRAGLRADQFRHGEVLKEGSPS